MRSRCIDIWSVIDAGCMLGVPVFQSLYAAVRGQIGPHRSHRNIAVLQSLEIRSSVLCAKALADLADPVIWLSPGINVLRDDRTGSLKALPSDPKTLCCTLRNVNV